jgi:hypothetical protein
VKVDGKPTSQFQQSICSMHRGASIEKMPQKMLFCCTSISADILLHILCYSFCSEHHILLHFCHMVLSLKASKNFRAKAAPLLHQKCLFN